MRDRFAKLNRGVTVNFGAHGDITNLNLNIDTCSLRVDVGGVHGDASAVFFLNSPEIAIELYDAMSAVLERHAAARNAPLCSPIDADRIAAEDRS